MKSPNLAARWALAALVLSLTAQPAQADVSAGVEAWNRGEYDKAILEWRDLALKGNADAQFNMGQAAKMGRGVNADPEAAADWYMRAVRQGHIQASDAYGHLMYSRGKIAEAIPYLQASADRDEARSQFLLGTELFNGTNIGKDWVRAYALMTRAASAGLGSASRALTQMDQYIPLEQRQQGIVMAGEIGKRVGKARNATPGSLDVNTKPPAKVAKPVTAPPAVRTASPDPKTPAAANGNWRIQLGAFSNEANARNLWNSLEAKIADLSGLTPYMKPAGSVTRLQAGPFASRTAAEAMCGKLRAKGQACVVASN
jgi:cell division septation protein DedD